MGFLSDWPKKYGEAKIGGIDPSASPQHFLGQILNNIVGDKKAEDGDSVRESASPIDFIAPEAVGALNAMAKRGSQVVADAAPRILGNEIGSVGSDVKPKFDNIKQALSSNLEMVKSNTTGPNVNLLKARRTESDQNLYPGHHDLIKEGKPGYTLEGPHNNTRLNNNERMAVFRDEQGKPAGATKFIVNENGEIENRPDWGDILTQVSPEHQRKGIASNLYNFAKENGFDIDQISGKTDLTENGAAFVNARRK